MSNSFNPYQSWLGLSGPQPANLYELIGVPSFTGEPPLLAEAIEERMARVTPHLQGPQAALAKQLMQELQQAKSTLLVGASRREYEQKLRQASAAQPMMAQAQPMMAAPVMPGMPQAMAAPYAAQPMMAQGVMGQPMMAQPAMAQPMMAQPVPMAGMPQGMHPGMNPAMMAQPMPPGYAPQPMYGMPAGQAMDPGFNSNSASAVRSDYRRQRKSGNQAAMLVLGVALLAFIGVMGFVFRGKFLPKPAQQQAALPVVPPLVESGPRRPDFSKLAGTPKSPAPPPARPNGDSILGTPDPSFMPAPTTTKGKVDSIISDLDKAKKTAGTQTAKEMFSTSVPLTPPSNTKTTTEPTAAAKTEPEPKPTTPAPTTPAPSTTPDKPEKKADQKELVAVKQKLAAAKQALVTHNVREAETQIDLATFEASAPDTTRMVEQMQAVIAAHRNFWGAVLDGAKTCMAKDELKQGDTVVATVVESTADKIVVRADNRNVTVLHADIGKLPAAAARVLAEKALGAGSPAAALAVGAFLAVDPKGDKAEARTLLEQSGPEGAAVAQWLAASEAAK